MIRKTKRIPIMYKLLCLIFFMLFVLSALVQYNDPDPIFWISLYSFAAASALAFYKPKLQFSLSILAFLVASVFAIQLLPELLESPTPFTSLFQEVAMKTAAIEIAREFYGLLITAIIMLILIFSSYRLSRTRSKILPKKT